MTDRDRREAFGDVIYEVWRSNHDPDAVDADFVYGRLYEGYHPDQIAQEEIERQDRYYRDLKFDRAYYEQLEQEQMQAEYEREEPDDEQEATS